MRVRPATAADVDAMRDVEVDAGRRFRDVGMDDVADDEPPAAGVLQTFVGGGRAWVAVDEADRVIGYLVASVVDGNGHVDQVSVREAHTGRGVGTALLDAVTAWAASHRLPALTLTTFRDVEWNGPYYERRGFTVMADDEIGPHLHAIVAAEAAHGLDPSTRCCMRRHVADHRGPTGAPSRT